MRHVVWALLWCTAVVVIPTANTFAQDGSGVGTFGNIKGGSARSKSTDRVAAAPAGTAPKGSTNFGFGSIAGSVGGFVGAAAGGAVGGTFGGAVEDAVSGAVTNGVNSGIGNTPGFVDGSSSIHANQSATGTDAAPTINSALAAPQAAAAAIQGNTEECAKNPELCPNNLMTAYDGWEKSNLAYARTPLLFNPRFGQAKRQYPSLTQAGLQSVNLSADDEVVKSTMAVYQPIRFIQQSFAWDKGARDAHLNLFATIRGIAVLTLSYLDKTVAAGLATVQQQTDNDTNAQMLKQLNWSIAKIANPNREMLYTDTEEKFDACMFGYGKEQANSIGYVDYKEDFAAIYSRVNVNCPACATLSPLGEGMESKKPGTVIGLGRYHYCVCCAETGAIANRGAVVVQDGTDISMPGTYSLAERAFNGKWMLLSKQQMEEGKK